MEESTCVVLSLLLVAAVSEPAAQWRATAGWGSHARGFNPSGITVVNPPQFATRSSRRGGPMPGYLPLKPVPSQRYPRWYSAETAPKPTYLRPPTNNYEKYPPYWSDDSSNHARNRKAPQQSHRHAKKDCNPCNSVPWIPIFKSPISLGLSSDHHPRELVPHVEVYPESSVQQPTVLAPANSLQLIPELPPTQVVEPAQELSSFPLGNFPVSPELLLPPTQPIPFPELSPLPVAPIHQNIAFKSELPGLVPPPPRATSNVIVTISETEHQKLANAHDQHYEPSSHVDTHAPQNQHNNKYYPPPAGGVDIVKSLPLAEYTSSIEYPFHVIQSPPYIDINTQRNNNTPIQNTYEKESQTGSQKVSDFLFGGNKNTDSKKQAVADSESAGSGQTSQSSPPESTETPTTKGLRQNSFYRDVLDPNILTPPPLPPHLTQLLPTIETSYLHPLFPVESRGIASVVNGELLPPPVPQPMNPTSINPPIPTIPPKKVQIIIPYYQTINSQELEVNSLDNGQKSINQTPVDVQKPSGTWPPIVVTEATQTQPRKIPATQDFKKFQNSWSDGPISEASQVKHILASNIRDLLKKEVEPKSEQNIRLQKNIDNWTALEYSNHKIVRKKEPVDLISHAQAVTSIPGTSISHLLLPSKKIPDKYFTTTSSPDFDDPVTNHFPTTGVSVNSQPFTTLSRYSSVSHTGSTTSAKLLSHTTPRSELENEIPEETTPGVDWSSLKVSIAPGTNEKVYVVTPVTSWSNTKRSTRHIDVTEQYSTNGIIIDAKPSVTTEKYNFDLSSSRPTTEQDKGTTVEENVEIPKVKGKPMYPKSTPLFRIKGNQTRYDKLSKFNKPKPIEKFFATTSRPITQNSTSPPPTLDSANTTVPTPTTVAAFPFRNGGELPLEMATVDFSSTQLTFKNAGERKTLIKQVKINNRRGKERGRPIASISLPRTTRRAAPELSSVTSTQGTPEMHVEVVMPHKEEKTEITKKAETKKATNIEKKKAFEKSPEKSIIKTDEPNITEDDRENINNLMPIKDINETMVAVETAMPRGVFGETKPDNSSRSLLDTIKLLRDFLADTSEEQDEEKSQQIGKVIEKIDAKKIEGSVASGKDAYKYNFPEFLVGELNLSKDEMSLVQGAMLELRKNKARTRVEQ